MSEQRPWWLGDEDAEKLGSAASEGASSDKKYSDFAGQVTNWVTWLQSQAQQRILEPHREHTDPREHPTCVLCRTSQWVEPASERDRETQEIIWVPTTIDPSLP